MKTFALLLSAALLAGCASAEYASARKQCLPEAYRIYPQNVQQQIVNRTRWEMRGTGDVTCNTYGSSSVYGYGVSSRSTTNCYERKQSVPIHYQEVVSFDANEDARRAYLSNCAMRLCIQQFGAGERCKSGL